MAGRFNDNPMKQKPVKVLFLTSDSSAVAGVGPCLADALENMDMSFIDPIVVCPWEEQGAATILPRVQSLGLPFLVRDLGKWMTAPSNYGWGHLRAFLGGLKNRVWSLASLIEREHIDLVYTNGLPCIEGALAARLTKRPHIWHLHEAIRNNPDLRSYVPAWLVEEMVGRLSASVIVNSNFLASELKRTARLAPIHIVHNGVDVTESMVVSPILVGVEVRRELGIELDAPIVLAVGTVAPRKGYSTLIKAASLVLGQYPNTTFLVAGAEVPEHAIELRLLVEQLGISNKFRFLGPRLDIPRLLAAADIFVHSAHQETFGRVLVEAMASGKPVVATCSGGPQEIVVESVTGYLVPIDGIQNMAERMTELLLSDELRSCLGEAGKQRAYEHFSVRHYASEIQNILLAAGKDVN